MDKLDTSIFLSEKEFDTNANKKIPQAATDTVSDLSVGDFISVEAFFISRKKSKNDFVLVRVLDASCYSIIHYVSIEGKVQEMEIRFIRNRFEIEIMKRERKLSSGSLIVALEAIGYSAYRMYEKIAKRHLKVVF